MQTTNLKTLSPKEKMFLVADAIEFGLSYVMPEAKKLGFDMDHYYSERVKEIDYLPPEEAACDTVACIAGHTAIIFGKSPYDGWNQARIEFNLKPSTANALFEPNGKDYDIKSITRKQAADCLRYFANTEVVDWDRVGVQKR